MAFLDQKCVVLVTGATGFIGSRLLEMSQGLFGEGIEIIPLTSKPIAGFRCVIHSNHRYLRNDFEQADVDNIDIVLHLGHYIAERNNNNQIVEGNVESINSSIDLMKAIPNIPRRVVFVSSVAVYGSSREDLITESSTVCPETPYALSKLLIEKFFVEHCNNRGIELEILRLSHVYGPGDDRNYVIPIWLKAKWERKPITVFGNPDKAFNSLYIDDCCRMIATACINSHINPLVNLVSYDSHCLAEIAEMCSAISNNPKICYVRGDDWSKGIMYNKSYSLCRERLCKEEISLYEGLKREYQYFEKMRRKEK